MREATEQFGQPIPRARLSDEVARRMRDAILTGGMRPGMHIVQEEWAQRLGVSRMPVRDAVTRLASEGLVEISSSNEATVASLSQEDIEDAYLLNAIVTGIAAERAALRMTEERYEELLDAHTKMIEAVARKDLDEAERFNWLFHRLLNRASDSPRLVTFLRTLSAGVPHFAVRTIEHYAETALEYHSKILVALRERNGREARALMESHVLDAGELATRRLRRTGFWSTNDEANPTESVT